MSEVLLLGVSDAGKTVYGAQLLGRFENPDVSTALRLRDTPESFKALQAAQEALQQGRYPVRTAYDTQETISLPLVDGSERAIDMLWPEFAGEAFKDVVVDARHLSKSWVQRTTGADGALLMIRPSLESEAPGVRATNSGVTERTPGTDTQQPAATVLAPDAQYVEVLQLMLFARGWARQARVRWPLAVVLSCWDEVDPDGRLSPPQMLADRYPLLHMFLKGTWSAVDVEVFGLSATERRLQPGTDGHDERFVDADPSRQGYVVTRNGDRSPDLTLPIAWLLDRAHGA
ncbi:hypothetical protein EHF33_14445 [Deinococcus psychrotolerans]|uniref:Double-GTPase 1 domain-containing protein n=1 Tax=Deinococcus psychrotolerans TaxID=2489213 RepID=A0A3G8YGZ8_9DEIO|nr:hypothetical protein [Deinococcus psychrotolerans]AZI44110.1 hypothetical protein EHF33_14445 [Deinococcus psychrotolerans]